MRETSFWYSIKGAIASLIFAAVAYAQTPQGALDSLGSFSTVDLGVSEISLETFFESNDVGVTEIKPNVWEGKNITAGELLAYLPGVSSYKQGGLGSFETISIRGISSKNILILIDGIPINDESGGAVDLSSIDLNQMEKVEVYKGNVPAKFGVKGIGGAINFITKNTLKKEGKILVAYGSHNNLEGAFSVAANVKDSVDFSASFSGRHSENDYEFLNRNGTFYNTEDDFTDKRKNAQYSDFSTMVKFRWLHESGFFSTFLVNAAKNFGGNPGKEDSQTQVANFKGESTKARYNLESKGYFNDQLFFNAAISASFQKNISGSYYPLDYIGYSNNKFLEYGAATYKILPEISAEFYGKKFTGSGRFAFEYERAEARGDSKDFALDRYHYLFSADGFYSLFKYAGFGGEGNIQFVKDELEKGLYVSPTGNKILNNEKEHGVNFAGKGFIRLGKTLPITGEISVGHFYKEPALMELYGVYPGVLSNPTLKKETATKFEATAKYTTPKKHTIFTATYFETYSKNGICYVMSANLMRAENLGEAFIRGVELELNSRPTKFLDIVLRGTFQNAEDRSDSKTYYKNKLPLEPAKSYYAESIFHLPFELEFSFAAEHRSDMYSDRANKMLQPSVSNFHSSLAYAPYSKTRLIFAVKNITDEKYRNFFTPYPMPGREYKFTITQGF